MINKSLRTYRKDKTMKEKLLKQLIEDHTSDESGLDYSALSNDINTQFNMLLDKKTPNLDEEKTKWETSYSKTLFDDLGIENINSAETLKSYIEERKDYNPEKVKTYQNDITRLKQERDVLKLNFSGDDDDMDYIIHKATTITNGSEDVSFIDAVTQLQESKPDYFGAVKPVVTNIKNNPPAQNTRAGFEDILMDKYPQLKK